MTEEEQETIVNEALRRFCHYLNLWWNSEPFNEDEKDPYTPEKFMTWDPEKGLYGHTDWEVLEGFEGPGDDNPAFQEGLLKIETSDGDEGGGSSLYVGLSYSNLGADYDPPQIEWIVHIFDLQPAFIYSNEEGYRTPPNGELKKEDR